MGKWMKVQLVILAVVMALVAGPVPRASAQAIGLVSLTTLTSTVSDWLSPRLVLVSALPNRALKLRYFRAELESSQLPTTLNVGTLASFSLLATIGQPGVAGSEGAARYLLSTIHLELASIGPNATSGRYPPFYELRLPSDRNDYYHDTGKSPSGGTLQSQYRAFSVEMAGHSARWTFTIGTFDEVR